MYFQQREYIIRAQKHECRNWDCSRADPFWEYLFRIFGVVFAVRKIVKTMAKGLSVWVCRLMISTVGVPLCICDSGTGLLCVPCVLGPSNSGSVIH